MSDVHVMHSSTADNNQHGDDFFSLSKSSVKDNYDINISDSEETFLEKAQRWSAQIETVEIIQASTIDQEILQSQTETIERACTEDVSQVKEYFANNLLQLLQSVEFEFGYKTMADDYIQDALKNYGTFAREWLNELFLQNFNTPHILSAILRAIAHLDYSQMYPQGITIAIAATRHSNIEVQECGVRCFENWESQDSIPILRSLIFSENWLNNYLLDVIADIEDMGAECL